MSFVIVFGKQTYVLANKLQAEGTTAPPLERERGGGRETNPQSNMLWRGMIGSADKEPGCLVETILLKHVGMKTGIWIQVQTFLSLQMAPLSFLPFSVSPKYT